MKFLNILSILIIITLIISCSQETSNDKDSIDPIETDESSAVKKADDPIAGDNIMAVNQEDDNGSSQQTFSGEHEFNLDLEEIKKLGKPQTFEERFSYGMAFDMVKSMKADSIPFELEYLILGLIKGNQNDLDFIDQATLFDYMQEYFEWHQRTIGKKEQKRMEEMQKLTKRNEENNDRFAKKFKSQKGVIEHPSGISYIVLEEGEGPLPQQSDHIKFNHTAKDFWGNIVFTTKEAGIDILPLQAFTGGERIMYSEMQPGEKRKAMVPPQVGALQFGPDAPFPPNTYLIYEMEFVGYPTMEEIEAVEHRLKAKQKRQEIRSANQ